METREIVRAAGGPLKLARELGIDHSTVCGWKAIPPKHAQTVAKLTGLSLHTLRPDIFPAPDYAAE